MSALATSIAAYKAALSRGPVIIGLYLGLRLAIYAVLAPLLGLLLNLAVSLSDQSALTDQDIAGFLLTPAGFIAAVAVLALVLLVEVLGFALMAALWRAGGTDRLASARAALLAVVRRIRPLIAFAVLFVLRVLVMALPFVLAGLLVAWLLLSDYDINYYLTEMPPEAWIAGGVIGLIVLALVVLLLITLTGWALALHLVLFEDVTPRRAFAESATRMSGRRFRLQREVVIWLAVRIVLVTGVGMIATGILHLMPLRVEGGLRLALALTLALVTIWGLANTAVSALALGALAHVINGFVTKDVRLETAPARAAGGLRLRLKWIGAGLAALVALGFWSAAALLDEISTEDDVEIIAHRGAAGSRPENTLASMEKALEEGADWVEIDVQETADGQVVVIHDSDYMKLSGVNLKIWDATLEELADIDIGGWFDPAYADQRTPLLRDVLELAKGRSKVLIELKYYGHDEDLENRVIGVVKETGMVGEIATMSLKYPAVKKMLKLEPDWRTGVLAATAVGNMAGLDGDFVALSMSRATPWLTNSIQEAGKDLYVWTVNDPLEMSKMISMGANGLITDEPALARQVLAIRAGLSTPERLVLWMSEELGLSIPAKEYRDASP
ncbi:glycerophosphodiester phosphodiesterase [Sedimentitalea todarodis]|uniref:Glycerophosphodiester phosphodiesterase n=1 Tax=Sedimentitalea todarodis TaxID=1631240 RepID=A0ABU3VHJ4_9RHOB|nr:glycerophosphodiester phosphodiesterase [Sedimentitalea todarodis]MDU9005663.1 glycerophosphodiester phosphodiesterase [Sedimentitalea todarodis]